jgi:hypothetical protein
LNWTSFFGSSESESRPSAGTGSAFPDALKDHQDHQLDLESFLWSFREPGGQSAVTVGCYFGKDFSLNPKTGVQNNIPLPQSATATIDFRVRQFFLCFLDGLFFGRA